MIATILIGVLTVILFLFLPGFFLSFIFFRNHDIDFIERFALSIALSLVIIPMIIFPLSLIGINITMVTVLGITGVIIILLGGYLLIKK